MVYKDKSAHGHIDLEATEIYIRSCMHKIGSIMLEKILNSDNSDFRGKSIPCAKGHTFEFKDYRDKKLLTVLGPVTLKRAYYYDQSCQKGYCPKDTALDIKGTTFSPGVRRIMGRVGAYRPFGLGHEDIKEMAGIKVNAKEVERVSYQLGADVEKFCKNEADLSSTNNVIPFRSIPIMYICIDGTGVPVVKSETRNRRGKGEDGQAKTREAKLGCIFTQTALDEKGYPVRDEGSTTYAGFIETAEEFGNRIYAEAVSRGIERAKRICVIGDGAPWIWNIADVQFYGAIQIIDVYHAREHYWKVAKIMFGRDKTKTKKWTDKRRKELDSGDVEQVVAAIKRLAPHTEGDKAEIEKEIGYFDKNKERMRYKTFRKQGLFVGSGVVEAGCRTVIGQRLKQSGMHWTVQGANNIIALRSCIISNRWEDFWEYRVCV
jgi:hypothetical protein